MGVGFNEVVDLIFIELVLVVGYIIIVLILMKLG